MQLLQSQNILFSIQKDKTQIIFRPNAIKNDDAFFSLSILLCGSTEKLLGVSYYFTKLIT